MKRPAAISYPSDVAFTRTVKAIQSRKGSRQGYASMEERGSWETRITPDLAEFIGRQASVFLGTASADGQPYIQHRGGPPGFLKGFCRKLWVETSKIITFCYLRSQRIELLCWTLGHSSGGSQLSLTNGMPDFNASDRTPSRPKRFKA